VLKHDVSIKIITKKVQIMLPYPDQRLMTSYLEIWRKIHSCSRFGP